MKIKALNFHMLTVYLIKNTSTNQRKRITSTRIRNIWVQITSERAILLCNPVEILIMIKVIIEKQSKSYPFSIIKVFIKHWPFRRITEGGNCGLGSWWLLREPRSLVHTYCLLSLA